MLACSQIWNQQGILLRASCIAVLCMCAQWLQAMMLWLQLGLLPFCVRARAAGVGVYGMCCPSAGWCVAL